MLACVIYPAWRGYDNFPALDRSWDIRAVQMFDRLTSAPLSQQTFCGVPVFGLDANWQVQNAAEYYMTRHQPGVAWFVTNELEWVTPATPEVSPDLSTRTFAAVATAPGT